MKAKARRIFREEEMKIMTEEVRKSGSEENMREKVR